MRIPSLHRLRTLTLSECSELTDSGLQLLGDLHYLQNARLDETAAGDQTALALKESVYLREVKLGSENLTDKGLLHISNIVSLHELNIGRLASNVTDAGLEHLWRLSHLNHFSIDAPRVTGSSLGTLRELPKLDHVHVGCVDLNDDGLKELSQLGSDVRSISIGDWRTEEKIHSVTPAGIQVLADLPKGTRVSFQSSRFELDRETLEQFRRSATHLNISIR